MFYLNNQTSKACIQGGATTLYLSSYATEPVWENVQIGLSGKAVFVCFLLAWWMDERWNALFQDRLGSI